MKIKKIIKETEEVKSFIFDKPFSFKPGQFVMVSIPGLIQNDREIKRAFSIASSPTEDFLMITAKIHGVLTTKLFELQEGDEINIKGPYGHFTYNDEDKDIVLVSAGTGIAPLRSIYQYLLSKGKNFKLFHTTRNEIIYEDELLKYATISKTQPEESWQGMKGRLTAHDMNLDNFDKLFFICGPHEMVTSTKEGLEAKGAKDIRTEKW